MYLKKYQIKVVNALKQFLQTAIEAKSALGAVQPNSRFIPDWVEPVFKDLQLKYSDRCNNGLRQYYPRIVIKVPTGGGKTLLAVEAIREYQNLFAQKRTGLVVWIVPSETIYSQTVQKIRDKGNPLRQLLDQCSGNRTIILEKGQRLTTNDIEENLVVLFVMIQAISRTNGREALKIFQDSGGYDSFFPADNRYDLHKQLLEQIPNLDFISALGTEQPLIKTSLGNAIRVAKPFIIIDEIHKVFSDNARKTIDSLNPEMILGLTATPKAEMNVLVTITGLELKDEEMVKLDMHILPPISKQENDWKAMVKEIKEHREKLEETAKQYQKDNGVYIRPTVLLQVEATGKDQRGKPNRVHSLDVKEYLISLEVNPDEIAIKTSSQNDIEDVNLFSQDCPVRYIITKEALREGWDFSFAYILGIIPNVNSNTGVTQLVGRILRQPFARKSGVKELDESYVYYTKGDTREILDRVSTGFKNEGLEDLVSKLKFRDNEAINATKTVKIKKDFGEKFQSSFYLPVWVMTDKSGSKRRFNYESDIKPKVDFSKLELSEEYILKLESSLSTETKERKAFAITLDDSSKASFIEEQTQSNGKAEINIDYLTRRLNELIENPFLARIIGTKYLEQVEKKIGKEKQKEHYSFIVSQLCKKFQEEKTKQEEEIFLQELKAENLVLAVSDEENIGFKVPTEDIITVNPIPSTYKYYLFDDVEVTAMNTLERKVGDLLDKQEKILWWFRNKVNKKWYSIQGWQQHKIRPDFVAAKKTDKNQLELVYIIESKGEHLLGNIDTAYKKKVLDVMTEQKQLKNIKAYQTQIPFEEYVINDKVECYLIEQGKEEEKLKELLK
ncbi:MAG: DEAD/DEAH box helicase family protein [Bacteroidetes bacterium]|nr:DEAD/DEAH box helicase family protein [Bacteroidota bacterium]